MLRPTQSNDDFASSLRLKQVQEKLDECRAKIATALTEMEVKFPKSIFDNIDANRDDFVADLNGSEAPNETEDGSILNQSMDDRVSVDLTDGQTSIPETSPPASPFPKGGLEKDLSEGGKFSPGTTDSKKSTIKHEMMKLFKASTGIGGGDQKSQVSVSKDVKDVIPLVTSIPRDPTHAFLLLVSLQLPKEIGIVSRLAVNADGFIAGGTVSGEVILFNKVPYSRSPDAMTRGHDGGVTSLLWLTGGIFITNGTDKKTLLWQSVPHGIDGPHQEVAHSSIPTCCCAHPVNKDIVIMGFLDNTISMYKIEWSLGGQVIRINTVGIGSSFTKPITAISVSPDAKRLVVGSSLGTIGIYDLSTMSLDVEVDCRNRQGSTSHGRKVVGLSWSRDSACVAVSSCDSRIRVVLISDLSRRTKFKSVSHFVNENLFLSGLFAPPEDERIVAVSESGHLCSWQLHTSSATNHKCLHCHLASSSVVSLHDKSKASPSSCEIVASVILPASDPFCESVQAKMFTLGDGFQKGSGIAV